MREKLLRVWKKRNTKYRFGPSIVKLGGLDPTLSMLCDLYELLLHELTPKSKTNMYMI
jgi:hypothetical protein